MANALVRYARMDGRKASRFGKGLCATNVGGCLWKTPLRQCGNAQIEKCSALGSVCHVATSLRLGPSWMRAPIDFSSLAGSCSEFDFLGLTQEVLKSAMHLLFPQPFVNV